MCMDLDRSPIPLFLFHMDLLSHDGVPGATSKFPPPALLWGTTVGTWPFLLDDYLVTMGERINPLAPMMPMYLMDYGTSSHPEVHCSRQILCEADVVKVIQFLYI